MDEITAKLADLEERLARLEGIDKRVTLDLPQDGSNDDLMLLLMRGRHLLGALQSLDEELRMQAKYSEAEAEVTFARRARQMVHEILEEVYVGDWTLL